MVELVFTGEPSPISFGHGILVLIPKGGAPGQSLGIAPLQVVKYKLVANIIERRLVSKIEFHDAVCGFRSERGTSTATIETKLLMQLSGRTAKPRYFFFLDLKKGHDALDMERTITILKGYRMGVNLYG